MTTNLILYIVQRHHADRYCLQEEVTSNKECTVDYSEKAMKLIKEADGTWTCFLPIKCKEKKP